MCGAERHMYVFTNGKVVLYDIRLCTILKGIKHVASMSIFKKKIFSVCVRLNEEMI